MDSEELIADRGHKPPFSDDSAEFSFTPSKYANAILFAINWDYRVLTQSGNDIYMRNAIVGKIDQRQPEGTTEDIYVHLCLPIDDSCVFAVRTDQYADDADGLLPYFVRLLMIWADDNVDHIKPPKHVLQSAAEILYDSGLDFSAGMCNSVVTKSPVYNTRTCRTVTPDQKPHNSRTMYEVTTHSDDVVGGVYRPMQSLAAPYTAARANGKWAVRAVNCAKGYTAVCDTAK